MIGPKRMWDLQWKLDSLAKDAQDISLLFQQANRPVFAHSFARMANMASKLSSFIRTHDELPPDMASKEPLQIVNAMPKNVRRLRE